MAKTVKSAKKFVKKHLKSAIAQRRRLKPMKKAMKRKLASSSLPGQSTLGHVGHENSKLPKDVSEMNVDEFLDGKFSDSDLDGNDSSFEDEEDNNVLNTKGEEEEFVDITPADLQEDISEDDDADDGDEREGSSVRSQNKMLLSEVEKHKKQLERLKEKDPEFFQFLEEHDKELLDFEDDGEEEEAKDVEKTLDAPDSEGGATEISTSNLSTSLVETWCKAIKEKHQMGTVCNLLRAYRTACHYGDGEEEEFAKYSITSSHVFNKIMFFTLSEIDEVFRKLLGMDGKERKRSKDLSAFQPEKFPRWKKVEPLVKSYFGNTLHILNQMTDNHMISFTIQRLKTSTYFLVALPRFARKFLKVALQFWGRGEGSVSLISFLFIREMAIHMGTDHLDACLKGIYKEYAANAKFANVSSLPRIRFTANCVVELLGIDLAASYQHAFLFIRQLAIILRNALTMKTKDAYKNVYSWQYVNCLELWVHALCMYASKKDLQPLVYPVTQIITGVARLVPTARYFPLRLQCVKMLNKLALATSVFIPVTELLLGMLEFKELSKAPTGGVGKSIDFGCVLKVSKPIVKTRAFQDECVTSVIEQFSEHMAHWSYAIAFPELALVPLMGLRRFMKETRVDRFRRQVKQLVDHIEMNNEFVGRKRDGVSFSPKDAHLVASFLQEEKKAGLSPLSKFVISLKQRAGQRRMSLHASSVMLKEGNASKEALASGDEDELQQEDVNVFSSDWLPPKRPKKGVLESIVKPPVEKENGALDADDIIEDLEFSSSDDDRTVVSNNKDQAEKVVLKKQKTSSKSPYGSSKKKKRGEGDNDIEISSDEQQGEAAVFRKQKNNIRKMNTGKQAERSNTQHGKRNQKKKKYFKNRKEER